MSALVIQDGALLIDDETDGAFVAEPGGCCCGGGPDPGTCFCANDPGIEIAPCCCIPVGDPGSCRHEYATCWSACDEDNVGCGGPGCSVCCGASGCESCGFVLPTGGWGASYFWTVQINRAYPFLLPDPVCLENSTDSTGGGDLFQPFNFGRLCESQLGTWAGSEVYKTAKPFGAPPELIHRVTSGTWGVSNWARAMSSTPTSANCIPGPQFVGGQCVEGSSALCPGGSITITDADASPVRERTGDCLATTWDYADPEGPALPPCTEGGQAAGVLTVSREGCGVALGAWSSPSYRLVEGVLVGVPKLEDPMAAMVESIPGERGRWATRRFHEWRRSTPGVRAMTDRDSGGRVPVMVRTLTARERARAFVDFGGRSGIRGWSVVSMDSQRLIARVSGDGLGDRVERGLSRIGITQERYKAAKRSVGLSGDCGCSGRKAALNRIGTRIGRARARKGPPA